MASVKRLVGLVFFGVLRLRGQQHGALAIEAGLVEVAAAFSVAQRFEGGRPVLLLALQIEQRFRRPAEFRVGL